jgi:hypothetical protein
MILAVIVVFSVWHPGRLLPSSSSGAISVVPLAAGAGASYAGIVVGYSAGASMGAAVLSSSSSKSAAVDVEMGSGSEGSGEAG